MKFQDSQQTLSRSEIDSIQSIVELEQNFIGPYNYWYYIQDLVETDSF